MEVCTGNNFSPEAFNSQTKNISGAGSPSAENQGLTSEDLRIALSELHLVKFHETDNSEDHKKRLIEMDIPSKKQFTKFPTFPCPQKVNASDNVIESSSELPRCVSLPPRKLVSAMKGGRERDAGTPRAKMQVKWAEDVYDPPATSMSHTLRNSKPRKSKKDDHKHKLKKKKKKPARDKQQLPNRAKVQETGSDGAHNWQDTTCGSSVMAGQLEKVQFSLAEADRCHPMAPFVI